MESALESNLILSISNIDMAKNLSRLASKMKCMAKIHIKVDTGMGRLGFLFEEALDAIKTIYSLPNIIVEGIFTHLSTAEEPDPTYTQYQIKLFRDLMNDLAGYLDPLPMFHMSNSAAVIQHPNTYFDMVRVGITLYGVAPVSALQKRLPIYPLLSFKTRVIHIKKARKGSSLSYGRSYICTSDKVIAIIPVGYSDGLARCMSGKIHVLIKGVKVPVVGTVCMDMTLIDITGLEDIKIGDEVVLIGSQGKESITAHDWAAWQDTIPYEVLCAIGLRVTRIYQYDKVALSI
jgi:alanine racemase